MSSRKELAALLSPFGQEHLLQFWDELSVEDQKHLAGQIQSLDLPLVQRLFKEFADGSVDDEDVGTLMPLAADCSTSIQSCTEETLNHYWRQALSAVGRGELAVVVLAGGQATRLGADRPKGTLSLGLQRDADSLLQMQAQQLVRLQTLAERKNTSDTPAKIHWYIMTSKATLEATREHVIADVLPASGLSSDQIHFFVQGELPAFTNDGKMILADKHKLFMAPDGNGGLYKALSPFITEMESLGIRYVHVYCVDNILCRVGDPHFVGYCIDKGADCANKVVEKTDPHEAVGVVCSVGGVPKVVEYSGRTSDVLSTMRDKANPDKLAFRAANIANHFFSLPLLKEVCDIDWVEKHGSLLMPYHPAVKKVPFVDAASGLLVKPEKPNGIKMEQFVFDVFRYSKAFYLWEVRREDEFSPLKNAESAGKDCLSTCRRDLWQLHRRWLQHAGAIVRDDAQPYAVEIDPTLTYCGEELQGIVSGKTLSTPFYLKSKDQL